MPSAYSPGSEHLAGSHKRWNNNVLLQKKIRTTVPEIVRGVALCVKVVADGKDKHVLNMREGCVQSYRNAGEYRTFHLLKKSGN